MIRHIVLFRWNADAPQEVRDSTLSALRALAERIPEVQQLHVGSDVANRGSFDFALTSDFATEDDISSYSAHPDHQAVIADFIKPYVAEMEVLDFEFE